MKKNIYKIGSSLLLIFLCMGHANAQLVAFPGAEGAGEHTTGGRGTTSLATKVFAVTSLLDDSVSGKPRPGTFRWALTQTATSRTIIFRVSGTIHLGSELKVLHDSTTIAGQTAPGAGICLADYTFGVDADNVIIRYIRCRMGDKNENLLGNKVNGDGNDDAFDDAGDASNGHSNIIIDHCTASWSDDEACTFYAGSNVTLQWNMMSEPLNYSYHFESGDTGYEHHAYGGIESGTNMTIHHNLYAHCKARTPRFDGDRNLGTPTDATTGLDNVDFVNNVIYNWSDYQTYGGEGGNYNDMNNYYKPGLSTPSSFKTFILSPYNDAGLPYGKFYLSGNYVDGSAAVTADNWKGVKMNSTKFSGQAADTGQSKVTAMFTKVTPALPSIATATQAYNDVLQNAGCSLPYRDTLDQRIVSNVKDSTGVEIDVQGGHPHGTAYAATVNAWPTLATNAGVLTTSMASTNTDSVPNLWLTQRGLLTSAALSGSGGYSPNGYTYLENFLNGDSIVAPGTLHNCVSAKSITATNSGNFLDLKDTIYGYYLSSSYLVSTDTNNVMASILDNGNYGTFNASYYTSDTIRHISSIPYLNRNVTITPVTPGNITGSVTVKFYFTTTEYNALKAADTSIHSLSDLRILKQEVDVCPAALTTATPTLITPIATGTYGTYSNGYYLEFTTSSFSTFFVGSKSSFTPPATYVFTGSGNWTTASNWQGSIMPPATLPNGSTISINGSGACTLNTTQTISSGGSLIVQPGKQLIIQSNLTITP